MKVGGGTRSRAGSSVDRSTPGRLFIGACLALALGACPGTRDYPSTDGAMQSNLPGIGCQGDCRDFVFDRILLPTSSAAATKYGLQVDGKSYNAMGDILSLVAQHGGSSGGVQQSLDWRIYKGDSLVLLTLKAADLQEQAPVRAQAWGGNSTCCSDHHDLATCQSEAQSNCFGGESVVKRSGNSPDNMIFGGAISNGAMRLNSNAMKLEMTLSNSGPLTLSFKHATLEGKVSASRITDGVLAGAIPMSDVNNTLIPELSGMLDSLYRDSHTDSGTKAMIKQLLDIDQDGSISAGEVANSPLLKTLLAGDVDVDNDGEKELSLGVGFSAVSCAITDLMGT